MDEDLPQRRRDARAQRLVVASRFYRTVALLLLAAAVVEFAVIVWQARHARFARAIRINGATVCFVRNEKAAEDVRARLVAEQKGPLPGAAFLEQSWESLNWPMDRDDKVIAVDDAVGRLRSKVTIRVSAAAVRVGKADVAILPDKELAQMALTLLKKEYAGTGGTLLEAKFAPPEVLIADVKVPPREIIADVHEAVTRLKRPVTGYAAYRAVSGDSWRKVSERYRMTRKSLRAMNPGKSDTLSPGTVIRVPAPRARLVVVTVKQEDREAAVPPPTQRFPTNAMPKGETRVTIQGVPGKKLVTEKVTYHNGKPMTRQKLNEVITEKPVPQRIMVGTA